MMMTVAKESLLLLLMVIGLALLTTSVEGQEHDPYQYGSQGHGHDEEDVGGRGEGAAAHDDGEFPAHYTLDDAADTGDHHQHNYHQQQQHHPHPYQQQTGAGGTGAQVMAVSLEVLSVSGCPTNTRPKQVTKACPLDGGVTLTVRGRGFPRTSSPGALAATLVSTKDRRATRPCENVRQSTLLPTLLFFCTLPPGSDGASYHLRVSSSTTRTMTTLRNAIQYYSKDLFANEEGDDDDDEEEEGETAEQCGAAGDDSRPCEKRSSTAAKKNKKKRSPAAIFDNYEKLGIGGLKSQLEELFRRAFSSRLRTNSAIASKIGMRHIKGVILHGPPGTGKTLIARKVSKMLKARTVQLISGPEIMSKFVGESEKNLRSLFAAAEADMEKQPDNPGLHVVIMDEIDAIMKPRGAGDDSGARAAYDSVTTQMLAYMDGLKPLNNLLIIGLTNRLSSMDKALLRPGRFEVQIRVPLPDDAGRSQIFKIHTKELRQHGYLHPDVSIPALSRRTAAMSGADIEGIVRSAVSYAFDRHEKQSAVYEEQTAAAAGGSSAGADDTQDQKNEKSSSCPPPAFVVESKDFLKGIQEVLAAKGSSVNTAPFLERGIVIYNSHLANLLERLAGFTQEMHRHSTLRRLRVVLEGAPKTGTTAVAALVARNSGFAYVNIITPESLVGMDAGQRIQALSTAFDEAANVAHACIVLDRIEGILEYSAAQNKVNPAIAQELSVLLDRNPALVPYQKESRLLVIITTSSTEAMKLLTPGGQFDVRENVRPLTHSDSFAVLKAYGVFENDEATESAVQLLPSWIGIKQLLLLVDMARSRYGIILTSRAPLERFDAASIAHDITTPSMAEGTAAGTGGAGDSGNLQQPQQEDEKKKKKPPQSGAASGVVAGDSTGNTNPHADEEAPAGRGRYLTVPQFQAVVEELGFASVLPVESSTFYGASMDL